MEDHNSHTEKEGEKTDRSELRRHRRSMASVLRAGDIRKILMKAITERGRPKRKERGSSMKFYGSCSQMGSLASSLFVVSCKKL